MAPTTPYAADLGNREPIETIRDTVARIEALTAPWSVDRFERSYAADKWSARLILMHLAQSELALGTRARMALTTPNYVSQNFDQDQWMLRETRTPGREAAQAFAAAARMNATLFEGLSAHDRATPFAHPEYGMLTVDWLIHQIAGHQIHHLKQLMLV